MNEREITSIDLVEGGNVIKQGHYLTLGFIPRDVNGDTVDLTGKTIAVALYNNKRIIYETTATFSGGVLRFDIDAIIESGNAQVEFTATSSTDAGYRQKFPTNKNDGRLHINRSVDDLGYYGVTVTTAATFQKQIDQAVNALPVDSETKMARVATDGTEYLTLKTRLDTEKQALQVQVDEKLEMVRRTDLDTSTDAYKIDFDDWNDRTRAAVIAGAGGSFNAVVGLDAITAENVSFVQKSSNLIDKTNYTPLTGIDPTTGAPMANTTLHLSHWIKVKPNTAYSGKLFGCRVGQYTEAGAYVSSVMHSTTDVTFTTSATTKLVRIAIATNRLDSVQMNEGSKIAPYEAFYQLINKNLVDVKNAFSDAAVLSGDESINFRLIEKTITVGSALIFWRNKRITLPAATINITSTISYQVLFYNPKTGAYVLKTSLDLTNATDVDELILLASINLLREDVYAVGYYRINSIPIKKYRLKDDMVFAKSKDFQFSMQKIADDFVAPSTGLATTGTGATWSGFNHSMTVADLYAKYDALMAAFPTYITRTLLGNDATGVHPIYKYSFTPQNPVEQDSRFQGLPKIIMSTGTHGFEKLAIYMMAIFFQNVCNNWKTNEAYEYFRWNVKFEVIPLVNPYGFANATRVNGNNVDINRNFDYKWAEFVPANTTDPLRSTAKGSAPFSEVETQYVRDFLIANRDAVYYADWHSNAGYTDGHTRLLWQITTHPDTVDLARDTLGRVTRKYQKQYPTLVPDTVNFMGYTSQTAEPMNCIYAYYVQNIFATTPEFFEESPTVSARTQNANQLNYEWMVNWLLDVAKFSKAKY